MGILSAFPRESQGLCAGERVRKQNFIVSSTQGILAPTSLFKIEELFT